MTDKMLRLSVATWNICKEIWNIPAGQQFSSGRRDYKTGL